MNAEVAKLIFIVIMVGGLLVWLWSLQMALGLGRTAAKPDWRMLDEPQSFQANTETGARTVRGSPETLPAGLARSLVQLNVGTFGSLFEIVERTPERIVLKNT